MTCFHGGGVASTAFGAELIFKLGHQTRDFQLPMKRDFTRWYFICRLSFNKVDFTYGKNTTLIGKNFKRYRCAQVYYNEVVCVMACNSDVTIVGMLFIISTTVVLKCLILRQWTKLWQLKALITLAVLLAQVIHFLTARVYSDFCLSKTEYVRLRLIASVVTDHGVSDMYIYIYIYIYSRYHICSQVSYRLFPLL